MSLNAQDMRRLERDAREIATRSSLTYLADAMECLIETRDPIAALALLSAMWGSGHARRDSQKSGLEEAGRWLDDRLRRKIDITADQLALELGWLRRLLTVHGDRDDDRGGGERVFQARLDTRPPPFGTHLALLRDKREAALSRAAALRAAAARDAERDVDGPLAVRRPEHLPDTFEARFASWEDARDAFRHARKRRKGGKELRERLLDVSPVAAELQPLATDLACSMLHTDGMLQLIDHVGDLPTFWIAVSDLGPRDGKRVPSRISFVPPDGRDRAAADLRAAATTVDSSRKEPSCTRTS